MAAPDLYLCTRDDVLRWGFGGDAAEARKLAGVDTWDPALLDDPIKAASSDLEVAAENKHNFTYDPDPTNQPFWVRKTVGMRAVYYLWFSHSGGKTCPEIAKAAKADTDAELDRLRQNKQGVGVKAPPPRLTSMAADLTNGGTFPRMSLDGWRGI